MKYVLTAFLATVLASGLIADDKYKEKSTTTDPMTGETVKTKTKGKVDGDGDYKEKTKTEVKEGHHKTKVKHKVKSNGDTYKEETKVK